MGGSFAGCGSRRLRFRRSSSSSGCRMIQQAFASAGGGRGRWSRRWAAEVPLAKGGRLRIEPTAAGIAIDVDGGGRASLETDLDSCSRDRPSGPPAQPGRDDLHRLHRPGPAWATSAAAGGGGEAGIPARPVAGGGAYAAGIRAGRAVACPARRAALGPAAATMSALRGGGPGRRPALRRGSASWPSCGAAPCRRAKCIWHRTWRAFLSGEEAAPWRQSLTRIGPVALMRDPALAPGSYRVEG